MWTSTSKYGKYFYFHTACVLQTKTSEFNLTGVCPALDLIKFPLLGPKIKRKCNLDLSTRLDMEICGGWRG